MVVFVVIISISINYYFYFYIFFFKKGAACSILTAGVTDTGAKEYYMMIGDYCIGQYIWTLHKTVCI